MNAGTVAIIGVAAIGVGLAVFYVAKKTKSPASFAVQAPSPAVAGINALGQLASKGIDAWIASKANKSEA